MSRTGPTWHSSNNQFEFLHHAVVSPCTNGIFRKFPAQTGRIFGFRLAFAAIGGAPLACALGPGWWPSARGVRLRGRNVIENAKIDMAGSEREGSVSAAQPRRAQVRAAQSHAEKAAADDACEHGSNLTLQGARRTLARERGHARAMLIATVGVCLTILMVLLFVHGRLHAREAAVTGMVAAAEHASAETFRATDNLARAIQVDNVRWPRDWRTEYVRARTRLEDALRKAPDKGDAIVEVRAAETAAAARAALERGRHASILAALGHREAAAVELNTSEARADRQRLTRLARDYVRAVEAFSVREQERLSGLRWIWLMVLVGVGTGLLVAVLTLAVRRSERNARVAGRALTRMASTCGLTGLPNRRGFDALLREQVSAGEPFALIAFDLDAFKPINDRFGHDAGDRVLQEVAKRSRIFFGGQDLGAARLGGDEFAAIVPLASDLGAEERMRRALAVASDLRSVVVEPFAIEGGTARLTASVGVACFPDHVAAAPHDDEGAVGSSLARAHVDLDEAMRYAADMALQHAKANRGEVRMFEPSMDVERRAEEALRAEVTRALAAREFEPFVQPVVDLETGRVASFEMLARWRRGDRVLGPGAFLDAMTRAGLLDALMLELLDTLLPRMSGWGRRIAVSINLSSSQIEDPGFIGQLCALIERSGIPGNRFEVELLESGALSSRRATSVGLGALRALGVRVALDDFGMGYSNFARLDRDLLDKLKIDRTFVMGMEENATYRSVVRAALDISGTLGVETVAEGIETAEAASKLRAMGCRLGQGYHFARPMPLDEAEALLTREDRPRERAAPRLALVT